MNVATFFSVVCSGNRLPQEGLILYAPNGVDIIGESSLVIVAGAGGDFVDMIFSFPSNATTLAIDSDLGGDVLFDSASAMAPIERTWAEWFALAAINSDYLWIGQRGVAGYSIDQSANSAKIISVLRCVAPPVASYWQRVDGTNILRTDETPIEVQG